MQERRDGNIPKEFDIRKMISRDMEQYESGDTYRGPIKRVVVRDMNAVDGETYKWAEIYLDWLAIQTPSGWVKQEDPEDPDIGVMIAGINLDYSSFHEDSEGVIHASIPYIGRIRILKEGDRLPKEAILDPDLT